MPQGEFLATLPVSTNPKETVSLYLLNCKIVCTFKGQEARSIKGINPSFQFDRSKALAFLDQSKASVYIFGNNFLEVAFSHTLEGGWGDRQHKGYTNTSTGITVYTEKNGSGSSIGEGTYAWAEQMGFSPAHCQVIAASCVNVDYHMKTRPMYAIDDFIAMRLIKNQRESYRYYTQSFHFNTHLLGRNREPAGTLGDTRLVHAVRCLAEAVEMHGNGDEEGAYSILGAGLHPLQDIFAHADRFVHHMAVDPFQHHIDHPEADDPRSGKVNRYVIVKHVLGFKLFGAKGLQIGGQNAGAASTVDNPRFNQRYSNTKTATMLYLDLFHKLSTQQTTPFNPIIVDRIHKSPDFATAFLKGFKETVAALQQARCPQNETLYRKLDMMIQYEPLPRTMQLPTTAKQQVIRRADTILHNI